MLFGENSREDYFALNYLHSRIMLDAGGVQGQRDARLTRAAVTRPFRTAFGMEIYGDIYAKAAALLDSVANRVVFLDGNKRTALLAAMVYLRKNKQVVRLRPGEGEAFMRRVVEEHLSIDEIAAWLKAHTVGRELAASL